MIPLLISSYRYKKYQKIKKNKKFRKPDKLLGSNGQPGDRKYSQSQLEIRVKT